VPGTRLVRSLVRRAVRACCAPAVILPRLASASDAPLVERVAPEFPREAIQAGAEKGVVRALGRRQEPFPEAVNSGKDGRNVEIDIEIKR
jgi:hypothetical protein